MAVSALILLLCPPLINICTFLYSPSVPAFILLPAALNLPPCLHLFCPHRLCLHAFVLSVLSPCLHIVCISSASNTPLCLHCLFQCLPLVCLCAFIHSASVPSFTFSCACIYSVSVPAFHLQYSDYSVSLYLFYLCAGTVHASILIQCRLCTCVFSDPMFPSFLILCLHLFCLQDVPADTLISDFL